MGKDTGIKWTDHTFNLVWGCVKVSRGCKNCYAEAFSKRTGNDVWGADKPRRIFEQNHWDEPRSWNYSASVKGIREKVFCGSMCDVFEDHPTVNKEREKLWQLIYMTQSNLDWQLLTKRPENIKRFLPPDWGKGWPNVWLGTSVENQEAANQRVPILLDIPARVRFLSCEPLVGSIDLSDFIGYYPPNEDEPRYGGQGDGSGKFRNNERGFRGENMALQEEGLGQRVKDGRGPTMHPKASGTRSGERLSAGASDGERNSCIRMRSQNCLPGLERRDSSGPDDKSREREQILESPGQSNAGKCTRIK